jgi:hypothetical protein
MLKRQRPRPGGSRGRADNCVSWNRRSLQIPPSAIAITAGQEAHSSAPTEEQAGRPAPRACPGHSPGCHCAPTRIARLARSIGDLRTARAEGASLRATEQLIDTGTAGGKCFLDMFGLFAEFEPNLRRERQLEGIAKAKAAGTLWTRFVVPRLISGERLRYCRSASPCSVYNRAIPQEIRRSGVNLRTALGAA